MKDLFITELAQYTAENKNTAKEYCGYPCLDLSSNHTRSPQSIVWANPPFYDENNVLPIALFPVYKKYDTFNPRFFLFLYAFNGLLKCIARTSHNLCFSRLHLIAYCLWDIWYLSIVNDYASQFAFSYVMVNPYQKKLPLYPYGIYTLHFFFPHFLRTVTDIISKENYKFSKKALTLTLRDIVCCRGRYRAVPANTLIFFNR